MNKVDDKIEEWCKENDIKCFRGDENNVLNRYYSAAKAFPSDYIVRITADDPFKEPSVIDEVVNTLINEKLDYVTNNFPPSFPEGLDCEAFTFQTLEIMEEKAMFTGDFVFKQSIGRTDLETGSNEEMKKSIEKLKKYPKDITLYPGHGDKTTLEEEIKTNPFFM